MCVPAEARGLWCVSAGVFRVQKRAQSCEFMPAEPRGVSGSVAADACTGQMWEVSIEFRIQSRSCGHMSAVVC